MENLKHRRRFLDDWPLTLCSALFLGLLFILLYAKIITLNLDHDEHQFIAGAVLLARERSLPYRDFAYFHVPLLVFIYALLFQLTGYYLLAARSFSVLCGWLLLATLFGAGLHLYRSQGRWTSFLVSGATTLLLASAPIFLYTSGRAWNHDLATLLAVWALLVHVYGLIQPSPPRWLVLSGLLIGLASATRLSLAPVFLPFVLSIWLWPGAKHGGQRGRGTVFFILGAAVGALPALVFLGLDPQGFIFGNWEYAQLNTRYRISIGYDQRMTLPGKLSAFALNNLLMEPGNLLLLAAYLWLGRPHRWHSPTLRAWLLLLAGVIFALLIGALAPTPSWPQYYYVLFPFFVLGALSGLQKAHAPLLRQRWFQLAGGSIVVLAVALTGNNYLHLARLLQPSKWLPVEFHTLSQQIAALAGADARVLTLAPLLPLEGNLTIYPELATGPFALRAGEFVPEQVHSKLHLTDGDRLETWLLAQPPQAILTGVHPNDAIDEEPLAAYARRHDFTALSFDDGETLWLPPRAQWGDAVQLITALGVPTQVAAGDVITPVLFLKNIAPLKVNLNVRIRVTSQSGEIITMSEGWPWGRPTSTWKREEIWYDGHTLHLPDTLSPGLYRIEVDFFDPENDVHLPLKNLRSSIQDTSFALTYFTAGEWPARPLTPLSPAPVFGQQVVLNGFDLAAPSTLHGADAIRVRIHWQPVDRSAYDYTAFVHLLGPDGQLVAQHDKQPLDGFYPTSQWLPGQPVADEFVLKLPAELAPGRYTLYTGLYNLVSGERLVAVTDQVTSDAWPLATFTVAAE